jgi:hypothetical protein
MGEIRVVKVHVGVTINDSRCLGGVVLVSNVKHCSGECICLRVVVIGGSWGTVHMG